jgi:hypothetical protein
MIIDGSTSLLIGRDEQAGRTSTETRTSTFATGEHSIVFTDAIKDRIIFCTHFCTSFFEGRNPESHRKTTDSGSSPPRSCDTEGAGGMTALDAYIKRCLFYYEMFNNDQD